jgi:hypothetical protein
MRRAAFRFGGFLAALAALSSQAFAEGGIFVGSTPCDAPVRRFLGIPARDKCDVIRWDLLLALDAKTVKPSRAVASIEYGVSGQRLKKLKREGSWSLAVGTDEHSDAVVYELTRGKAKLGVWKITDDVVHLLDAKRRLLAGNGGWGYSLSHALAEKPQADTGPIPEMSYKLEPLATGPKVYGVFEGRTPCELSQVLGIQVPAHCEKIKWRLTLFQDAGTRTPTNYRLEGGLFADGARKGSITTLPGTPFDATAKVLRLEAPEGQQPVFIMRGDDNVLFFLDSTGKLALGNRDFGYALNRLRR